MEPLACAVHGVAETPIAIGDTVAVNGAGPIGLMFVRWQRCEERGSLPAISAHGAWRRRDSSARQRRSSSATAWTR